MRTLAYLSPTSISKYLEDAENFYIEYLADSRPKRQPQTRPMSIGSAFDAYSKSYLFEKLIGKSDPDYPKFQFESLFIAQVEPHNRDWARKHGNYAFTEYVRTGALADLMVELSKSIDKPRFEMSIQGMVSLDAFGISFLGKPDVFYKTADALDIISDWKVNGYCSKSAVSPMKEYVKIIPSFDKHKDAWPITYRGTTVNASGAKLHELDESWARQTVIYAWLCGCPVGSDFVHAIDQVACNNRRNPLPGEGYPELRFAQHRYRSDPEYQYKLFRQCKEIWTVIQGGQEGYFRGLPPEDSKSRCMVLEQRAFQMFGNQTEDDEMFNFVCSD